jgi:hypothetical protein
MDGQTGRQVLEFRFPLEGGARVVRLEVPMPDPASVEFTRTHTGRPRQASAAATAWEQACRQRWRQTKLVLLAKLEAIECGISTFEREFMPDLVTPDGRTIAEHVLPQLATALDGGGAVGAWLGRAEMNAYGWVRAEEYRAEKALELARGGVQALWVGLALREARFGPIGLGKASLPWLLRFRPRKPA